MTDGSTLGFNQNPEGLDESRVELLRRATHQGISDASAVLPAPFLAFGQVIRKYAIPVQYADDLLDGMKHDAEKQPIKTTADLLLYCYQVAGTVGLMMCHIMGIKSPRALRNAVDLGIALQMTNIARDIGEDFRVGKIYLPEEWLNQVEIQPSQLLNPKNAKTLDQLVERLLTEAEAYYQSGLKGLIDLPWRAALAVSIATFVYRGIGLEVRARGPFARHHRVVLTRRKKLKAFIQGGYQVFTTIPNRLIQPRPTVAIEETWRYP